MTPRPQETDDTPLVARDGRGGAGRHGARRQGSGEGARARRFRSSTSRVRSNRRCSMFSCRSPRSKGMRRSTIDTWRARSWRAIRRTSTDTSTAWHRSPIPRSCAGRSTSFSVPRCGPQDAKLFVASLLASNEPRDLAWELIRKRWGELQKKTGEVGGNTVIVNALAAFCDATTAKEIRSFFETHKVPDAERTLQQSLERIESCFTVRHRPAPETGRVARHRAAEAGGQSCFLHVCPLFATKPADC